jgi:peptide deformylase
MNIVHHPHPSLRRKAHPVSDVTAQVRQDAAEMLRLMYEGNGIGLAANQVDLPYRIIVLNMTGDPEEKEHEQVILNPEILEQEGELEEPEGCLSLPGVFVKVRRAQQVRVRGQTLDGGTIDKVVSDLESRAWQHEVDHLDGVLIIDKAISIVDRDE